MNNLVQLILVSDKNPAHWLAGLVSKTESATYSASIRLRNSNVPDSWNPKSYKSGIAPSVGNNFSLNISLNPIQPKLKMAPLRTNLKTFPLILSLLNFSSWGFCKIFLRIFFIVSIPALSKVFHNVPFTKRECTDFRRPPFWRFTDLDRRWTMNWQLFSYF